MTPISKIMEGRGRWLIVLGAALVLLALAAVGPPPSWADVDYKGGLIQTHRYRDPQSQQPSAPGTMAPRSPSSFPDNDAYYPSFSEERGPVLPPSSAATMLPFNISPAKLPWNQAGFVDYDEPLWTPQEVSLSVPKQYALHATALYPANPAVRPQSALLIAHLPSHAVFWVEEKRTLSTGQTRYFHSPQLPPGRKYGYTVRVAWLEGDRWVTQSQMVPVQAGMIQAIYLRSLPESPVTTEREPLARPTKTALKSPPK